ncbi:MAG: hypothetical protein M3N15_08740, partial [Actinomycetota bacterium]|nr:hypothetical protein [Actinomycetota bacterium]
RVARSAPRMDYHLAITLRDTAEMVGLVDLRITSARHRSAELGRWATGPPLFSSATKAAKALSASRLPTKGMVRVA